MWKTTFYLYNVKKDPEGKNFISGGTKLVVENDKLKDLKIEKPLDNFDLDMYSDDACAVLRSTSPRLDKFSRKAGSGWIVPEITSMPNNINLANITWRASTNASWITITNTSGEAVDDHDDGRNLTNGDVVNFTVSELPDGYDNREGNIYIDFYYKNVFLQQQNEGVEQDDEDCDIGNLQSGEEIPTDAVADQPDLPCSTGIKTYKGGNDFPHKLEFNLGSPTGTVPVYFNPKRYTR